MAASAVKGHSFSNWASTYQCHPELYCEPRDITQLQEILAQARLHHKAVRVVGNGHSPSDIVCTPDYLISLKHMNKIIDVDKEQHTVLAEAGMLLTEFHEAAGSHGLALSVLGSVSEVSLAGVVSTGTHGTGINYSIISSSVLELELVTASGEIQYLTQDKDKETLSAAVLSLGAFGVITKIRFQCEPAFNLKQTSYGLPLKDVIENLDVHLKSSDHFRFLWHTHTDNCIVFHALRTQQAVQRARSWIWEYLVGFILLEFLFWISTWVTSLVPRLSKLYYSISSKRSVFVDKSHNVFNFDCLFQQYVMEWGFPIQKTGIVLYELQTWLETSSFKAHFPVEVRFVKADDIMLSPAYGRDSCYINIIMYRPYNKLVEHAVYWQAFKDIMKKYGGRPHWAKDHLMTSQELRPLYPKWDAFKQLRQKYDPSGIFLNDNLRQTLGVD